MFIPIIVVGYISYEIARDELDLQGKIILKNAVNMTLMLIDAKQKEVAKGTLELNVAQEEVKQYILGKMDAKGHRPITKLINLGTFGYMGVQDEKGLEIAHPVLEGKNVWNVKDKTGSLFVQKATEIALKGGGFSYFHWTLPGSKKIAKKIVYSKKDPHWNWIVSSGSYMLDYNKGSNKILNILLFILVISISIGVIIIFIFATYMSRPIIRITSAVREISDGNLNVPEITVKSSDETGVLGTSFNKMVNQTKVLIEQIKNISEITTASSQFLFKRVKIMSDEIEKISSHTTKINDGIHENSSTVEEVNASIESLNDNVNGLLVKADEENNAVKQIEKRAEEMKNIGASSIKEVKEIYQLKYSKLSQSIKEVAVVEKVQEMAEVITGLANQTDLLALNAAIEAARAGEYGKGFAVVAEEVSKMAFQTTSTISEIDKIIENVQSVFNNIVTNSEEVLHFIDDKIINDFETLVEFANEYQRDSNYISELVQEFVVNLNNMANSFKEINFAVNDVSETISGTAINSQDILENTKEFSLMVKELEEIADEQNKLSEQLHQNMKIFKI